MATVSCPSSIFNVFSNLRAFYGLKIILTGSNPRFSHGYLIGHPDPGSVAFVDGISGLPSLTLEASQSSILPGERRASLADAGR